MEDLKRDISVLAMLSFVVILIVVWIGYFFNSKDTITWVTLIIGSSFALAITIIISEKSERMLSLLEKSENEKKEYAKFIVRSNFTQMRKLVDNYFDTIRSSVTTIKQQRVALLSILPSLKTFLNICEISLPNIGNFISKEVLEEINTRFVIIHKLLVILESGSDLQFEENISNLNNYTKSSKDFLDKM